MNHIEIRDFKSLTHILINTYFRTIRVILFFSVKKKIIETRNH